MCKRIQGGNGDLNSAQTCFHSVLHILSGSGNNTSDSLSYHLSLQGGFLVMQPSVADYENIIEIVMTKEFRKFKGWDSSTIGWFWGGMTVQVRDCACV